jgi:hypothetical protein
MTRRTSTNFPGYPDENDRILRDARDIARFVQAAWPLAG